MKQMQAWVMMVAAVACVAFPVTSSAGGGHPDFPGSTLDPHTAHPGLVAVPLGAGRLARFTSGPAMAPGTTCGGGH